jgi:hypothetical protein
MPLRAATAWRGHARALGPGGVHDRDACVGLACGFVRLGERAGEAVCAIVGLLAAN